MNLVHLYICTGLKCFPFIYSLILIHYIIKTFASIFPMNDNEIGPLTPRRCLHYQNNTNNTYIVEKKNKLNPVFNVGFVQYHCIYSIKSFFITGSNKSGVIRNIIYLRESQRSPNPNDHPDSYNRTPIGMKQSFFIPLKSLYIK